MKQEDKDLLLKDLCARLPYRVMLQYNGQYGTESKPFSLHNINSVMINNSYEIEGIKPYLRPMSSMTEEEESEYHGLCYPEWNNGGWDGGNWHYHNTISSIDWLNAHHFDYRNLIKKGLALEAPYNND